MEKPFNIFKFRTMHPEAEKYGCITSCEDDPRITGIGSLLRKYKFDELPQLINVFKGEMSLVGPRPEFPQEVASYSTEEKRILTVKPGITDWASLKFHDEDEILKGSQDPYEAYKKYIRPEKMKLALKYVDNASFRTDVKIIYLTLKTLIVSRLFRNRKRNG